MNEITIIIPNYNKYKYLQDCIDSLYRNISINFSLIVVDNASTDSDYKFINEYNKDIIFKRLDKNYGFSYAVNIGIKMAKTPYIVLLNNDTTVKKNWLENMYLKIVEDEKIFSVCGMMIRMFERDKIDDAGDEYNAFGWAYKMYDGKNIQYKKANVHKEIFSSCAGAAIYRKSIFEKIGYFDENFFAYMEDVDLSYRANIYGYKNVYSPNSKLYHVGSGTTGGKYNEFKVNLSSRNNIYVIHKNMPFLQILLNLPFLFLGFFIKYIFFLKKGYGKQYISGIIDAFSNLKTIRKTKFEFRNIFNYVKIEYIIIKNIFSYIFDKIIWK